MCGRGGVYMISVMIVDDEYIVREDLKTLIDWEEQGFRIVAEAENGIRGLGMYQKYRPQLVFADIKMPVMDGLAMSRKILEENPGTKIILLSAYSDFDYAREAMEQGICSYLLKHEIDEESLIKELRRVKEIIQDNEQKRKSERNRLLKQALLEDKTDNLSEFDRETMCMAVILIHGEKAVEMRLDETEEFEEEIRKVLASEEKAYLIGISSQEYVLLFSGNMIRGRRERKERVRQIYGLLKEVSAKRGFPDISLAFSENDAGLESAALWYRKTKHLLEYRYFEKDLAVFYAWDYEAEAQNKVPEQRFHELTRDFRKVLHEKEAENLCRLIPGVFEELKAAKDPEFFDKMIRFLGMSLWNEKAAIEMETYVTPEEFIRKIKGMRDIDDMANWFCNEFGQLYGDIQGGYSPRVRHAVQYIKDNYNKDITLAQLAEVMEISEIYASTCFKKEVGMSYVRYLTEYRMKVAKKLIKEGYKVYEISEMVGYQTVQYFTTMFKKYAGCTPKEYYNQGR